jgi:sensor domain CHASE-containing protein
MKIKNLHHKIPSLIPSILLFLILLIILSIFQFRALHQNARKMQELTNVMNKQTAIRIENWISMRITLVKLLAKSLNHADHVNPQLFKAEAHNLIITYPGFQAINWIDADGTVRIVLPFEPNKRVLNKNLYFHPILPYIGRCKKPKKLVA